MSRVLDRLVKNDHRIMSCDYFGSYNEGGDGYFMYINDGYYCGSMGMATIAEYTVKKVLEKVRTIVSCGDGGYGCHCGCWESNNDCPTAGKVEEE